MKLWWVIPIVTTTCAQDPSPVNVFAEFVPADATVDPVQVAERLGAEVVA